MICPRAFAEATLRREKETLIILTTHCLGDTESKLKGAWWNWTLVSFRDLPLSSGARRTLLLKELGLRADPVGMRTQIKSGQSTKSSHLMQD